MADHIPSGKSKVPGYVASYCGFQMTLFEAAASNDPTCEVCCAARRVRKHKDDLCQQVLYVLRNRLILYSKPEREDLLRELSKSDLTVTELVEFAVRMRW